MSRLKELRNKLLGVGPPPAKLIVGLGNPGAEYAHHRHNAGFHCLDRLAKAHGLRFTRRRFQASLAFGTIAGVDVALAKPLTFMNLSGRAVGRLVRGWSLAPSDMLVIYDDLDLPLGRIRLRKNGSAGGHRGMQSIIDALDTRDFPRLRIGIGRPSDGDEIEYVLSNFDADEQEVMETAYERATAAIECFLREGIAEAMNRFNRIR
jgi:PTH1 family peptidyl-tRNA hydrolase